MLKKNPDHEFQQISATDDTEMGPPSAVPQQAYAITDDLDDESDGVELPVPNRAASVGPARGGTSAASPASKVIKFSGAERGNR